MFGQGNRASCRGKTSGEVMTLLLAQVRIVDIDERENRVIKLQMNITPRSKYPVQREDELETN